MLDTEKGGIVSLGAVFLFLTTVTVVLRLYARYRQKTAVWFDDYSVIGAWVGLIGLCACIFYGVDQKFVGYKEPKDAALVAKQHPTMERVFLGIDALGAWTFGMSKISALFFYRRIFCHGSPRDAFHWLTIVFIAIVAGWIVTFVVMPFNTCGNHSLNWDVQPGHSALCKLIYPYFRATAISDFALDVLILALPLHKIWSLNTTTARKVAISGVFLMALVGLGASCARMVIYNHIVQNGRGVNDEDGYQTNTQMAYYALLEAGFTIVSVNLPSLWYFVNGMTTDKVVQSVRSIISLGSRRGSETSRQISKTSIEHDLDMTYGGVGGHFGRLAENKTSVESYAMTDLEAQKETHMGIRVERGFGQTEEAIPTA